MFDSYDLWPSNNNNWHLLHQHNKNTASKIFLGQPFTQLAYVCKCGGGRGKNTALLINQTFHFYKYLVLFPHLFFVPHKLMLSVASQGDQDRVGTWCLFLLLFIFFKKTIDNHYMKKTSRIFPRQYQKIFIPISRRATGNFIQKQGGGVGRMSKAKREV